MAKEISSIDVLKDGVEKKKNASPNSFAEATSYLLA